MERLGGPCSSTSIRSEFKVSLARLVYLTETNVGRHSIKRLPQLLNLTSRHHLIDWISKLGLEHHSYSPSLRFSLCSQILRMYLGVSGLCEILLTTQ